MPLLDVALAFALTMLGVATTVSIILGALRRMASVRSKLLRQMVNTYLQQEFQPRLEAALLKALGPDKRAEIEAQLSALMAGLPAYRAGLEMINASKLPLPPDTRADLASLTGFLKQLEVTNREHLGRDQLLETLKAMPAVAALTAQLGAEADRFWTQAGAQFDTLGEAISESFRSRSRAWSTAIALVLALVVNIDAIQILRVYFHDKTATATVVATMDGLVAGYQAAQAKAQEPVTPPQNLAELQQAGQDIVTATQALQTKGFPIGPDYFPWCKAGRIGVDARCDRATYPVLHDDGKLTFEIIRWERTFQLLAWLAGVILTAFLAGLGGPFWYDAITGLASASRALKSAKQEKPA